MESKNCLICNREFSSMATFLHLKDCANRALKTDSAFAVAATCWTTIDPASSARCLNNDLDAGECFVLGCHEFSISLFDSDLSALCSLYSSDILTDHHVGTVEKDTANNFWAGMDLLGRL